MKKLLVLAATLSFTAAAAQAQIGVTNLSDLHAIAVSAQSPAFTSLLGALLLAVWGLYALSASGSIPPLPFMQQTIYGITAIYLVRGLFLLPQLFGHNIFAANDVITTNDLLVSAAMLLIGVVHVAGLARQK